MTPTGYSRDRSSGKSDSERDHKRSDNSPERSSEQPGKPRGPRGPSSSPQSAYSREFAEAVGRTIKVLRTDLGIERRELAARVGISYSYLTEIENGNKPASSTVLRPIAHALGLRLSQLTEQAELRLEARAHTRAEGPAEPTGLAGPPGAPLATAHLEDLPVDGPMGRHLAALYSARSRDIALRSPSPQSPPTPQGAQQWAIQPSLRGQDRDLRGAVLELERLLHHMAPDDIERLLDYARRLAR